MTNNDNLSDRLDAIEATVEEILVHLKASRRGQEPRTGQRRRGGSPTTLKRMINQLARKRGVVIEYKVSKSEDPSAMVCRTCGACTCVGLCNCGCMCVAGDASSQSNESS